MKLSLFKACKSPTVHNLEFKCLRPKPDELMDFEQIENQMLPKQGIRLSAQSKMSEEVRYSKESTVSKNLSTKEMLNDSTNSNNKASEFGSIILSEPHNRLFPHKCKQIQDEYLTCQCSKYPNQKCTLQYCSNNCVNFKSQMNPSLYQQMVRDSANSAQTSSGVGGSIRGSDYFCEIPVGKRPEIKLTKNATCQCEAGGCKNGKCPCKRKDEFCDLDVCDCRECRNMMAGMSMEERIRGDNNLRFSEEYSRPVQEKSEQQKSSMESEDCAQFEEMNFFLHIKKQSSMMDEER